MTSARQVTHSQLDYGQLQLKPLCSFPLERYSISKSIKIGCRMQLPSQEDMTLDLFPLCLLSLPHLPLPQQCPDNHPYITSVLNIFKGVTLIYAVNIKNRLRPPSITLRWEIRLGLFHTLCMVCDVSFGCFDSIFVK